MSRSISQFFLRRSVSAILFALLVVVLAPVTAAGAFGGVDRSFGQNGRVDLSYEPSAGAATYALGVGTGPDRKIYVVERTSTCMPSCATASYVIRFHPNGRRDWSYAADGTAELPSLDGGPLQLLVDRKGRQLLASPGPGQLQVYRLSRNGHPDPSFGAGGLALVDCTCQLGAQQVLLGGPGYLTIADSYTSPGPDSSSEQPVHEAVVTIRVLAQGGGLDPRFGHGGVASAAMPNTLGFRAATRLAGGGLAILGRSWSGPGAYVLKVGSRGGFNRRYAERSRKALTGWANRHGGGFVFPTSLVPRRGGLVDVLGGLADDGTVFRLRRDGGFDHRFGESGFKSLPWGVTSAVAASGGRVFTVGGWGGAAVGWLSRGSQPLRSFANGDGAPVLRDEPAQVALQGGRLPIVLEPGLQEGCRRDCPPPAPSLVRITAWAPR